MLNWLTTYKRIELKPKSYDTLESTIHHQIIPYFKGMQFFSVTHEDIQNSSINSMMTGVPIPLSEKHIWRSTAFTNTP